MKNIYKALLLIVILSFSTGCKKEEDYKETDEKIIKEYLQKRNLTAERTSSGLYYIIDVPGDLPKPTISSTVTLHYKGYLINGKVFDNTEGDKPVSFPLTHIIEGMREGLQLFGEGGIGKLLIPSYLGYGNTVMPGIPVNSVLIFDIHLINVE